MRALENRRFETGPVRHGDIRTGARADPYAAVGELLDDLQTVHKIRSVGGDHHAGIGRQRVAVHGRDEDGLRYAVRRGHPAERSGAQCCPQAAALQEIANLGGRECLQFLGRVAVEAQFIVAADADLDALEHPPVAAYDP